MAYKLDLGLWNGVFAVPFALVDKHLKLARGNEIKVILYALRYSGESFEIEAVAKDLGLSEDTVEEAFEYWIQEGLIQRDGRILVPKEEKREVIKEKENTNIKENISIEKKEENKVLPVSNKFRALKPDSLYVAKRINESDELRDLVSEIEMCLGKTITPTLLATIINAYDDYNLPTEVIMMLFSYVKNIGKTSTPYIESVIHEWGVSGVNTAEAADKKIKELDDKMVSWKKITRIFSIDYRSPSKKEEEYAYIWLKKYNFPEELIREAYERCVNALGRMQIKYINAIMEKWHSQGIKSLEELNLIEEKKTENKKENNSSFNISDLENIGLF